MCNGKKDAFVEEVRHGMKEKIKHIITLIFGTKNNLVTKLNLSIFITGILFLLFTIAAQEKINEQAENVFSIIAGVLLGLWIITMQSNNSIYTIIIEIWRMIFFSIILIFSLNFCLNTSTTSYGVRLIINSIFSCIGIVSWLFYLISKFIDAFLFIKSALVQIRNKILTSIQTDTASRVTVLMENITAFLVAIAGFTVALKAIIESLANFFK